MECGAATCMVAEGSNIPGSNIMPPAKYLPLYKYSTVYSYLCTYILYSVYMFCIKIHVQIERKGIFCYFSW